jgi:DNA (cytosine-5)-methyltransferase 1
MIKTKSQPIQLSLVSDDFCDKKANDFKKICDILNCDINQPAWTDCFGESLSIFLKNEEPIPTLSLFSGAGGLDTGFNDSGFNIIECVELERKFCDTLEMNNGKEKKSNSKINCIDIREYISSDLPQIDFIIGGPPCQTFSAAGRRANGVSGTDDERGVLFKEYVRLLKELSPKGFLFENVYGITGAQNGTAWQEILNSFSDAGYKLFFRILDAADYGVPQHRERLIIVGLKEGSYLFPRPTHGPDSPCKSEYYTAKQAVDSIKLTEVEKIEGINGRYGHLLNDIPPGLNYSFYTEEMGHPTPVFAWRSKFSDFLYKADPNTPVRTIKAQGGQYTGPFHWNNRNFSVSEYKRLQTFPDTYIINGNKQTQLHQIGNSVPPQLARILAVSIRQQIFNTDFGVEIPLLNEYEELGFRKRKRMLTAQYQEKAKNALKALQNNNVTTMPKSHDYFATMTDKFDFCEIKNESADFYVSVEWTDILKIRVSDSSSNNSLKNETRFFSICISPEQGEWGLNVNEIQIDCFSDNFLAYTVAWKATEYELIKNNIKADLVQLCGYYQYTPKIKCSLSYFKSEKIRFLTDVVNGNITRKMITTSDLADEWKISPNKVLEYAQRLRRLGYEIRNSVTNPQIENDEWLIPYAFPTLTPQSVQLRKSLVR